MEIWNNLPYDVRKERINIIKQFLKNSVITVAIIFLAVFVVLRCSESISESAAVKEDYNKSQKELRERCLEGKIVVLVPLLWAATCIIQLDDGSCWSQSPCGIKGDTNPITCPAPDMKMEKNDAN